MLNTRLTKDEEHLIMCNRCSKLTLHTYCKDNDGTNWFCKHCKDINLFKRK